MGQKYEHILYETTDDGITTITLNRPAVRNAFNKKMGYELRAALYDFGNAEDEKFCVLTGAGSSFCAGEDLKNMDIDAPPKVQAENTEQALASYHGIIFQILEIQKPIVALLNGTAAGAGLSIALACDERFAVEGATLVPGFSRIGLVPDAGMIPLLERLTGYLEVRRWLEPGFSFTVRARENHIIPNPIVVSCFKTDDDLIGVIREFASKLFQTRSLAEFGATKTILNAGMINYLLNCVFPLELEKQVELEQGDDFREGLTAFREKRAPKFNQKRAEG